MTNRLIPLLLLFAVASSARANMVSITISTHGDVAREEPGRMMMLLAPALRSTGLPDAANTGTVRIETMQPAVTADLAPGTWRLDIQGAGVWHRSQYVQVAGLSTAVTADVWPAGAIVGTVAARDTRMPTEVAIHFEQEDAAAGPGEGDLICPVRDGTFRCAVPAVTLDLRLHVRGCVSVYLQRVGFASGKSHDLGTVTFRRGSAIVGLAELAKGVRAPFDRLRVRAVPLRSGDVLGAMMASPAVVSQTGFFHIDGVPPGKYTVQAVLDKDLSSAPVEVVVRPDMESRLVRPLLVDRPATLTVAIDPPLDPQGEPWHVVATRIVSLPPGERFADALCSADGTWTSSACYPGRYELSAGPQDGKPWHTETVEVNGSMKVAMHLEARPVRGRLRVGEHPLSAVLTFSCGVFTQSARSDEAGNFHVLLPDRKSSSCDVRVKSDMPKVERFLPSVAIPEKTGEELLLRLPMTTLSGVVVDAEGKQVARALLTIHHIETAEPEPPFQPSSDEDGAFEIHGLAPGRYVLKAAAFLQESSPVEVTVTDDLTPEPLRITLEDEQKIAGRVFSEAAGIPGVAVVLLSTDVPWGDGTPDMTDANGRFASTAPPHAREIDVWVFAPGFAFKMVHTNIRHGELELQVDQRGGTVVVPAATADGRRAYLQHAGALIPAQVLVRMWAGGTGSSGTFAIPSMEAGQYAVCMLAPSEERAFHIGLINAGERCRDGFLAPFGSLDLSGAGR